MADCRLLLNETLRETLLQGWTFRAKISRFARDRAVVHRINGSHAVVLAGLAASLLKARRTRVRRGLTVRPPFVRRTFLRADDATFHLDQASGRVRLSLRQGEWTSFAAALSPYHHSVLSIPGTRVKQLHLTPDHAVLILERPTPEPFAPTCLIALDTNEASLDGVVVSPRDTHAVRVPFAEIPVVQARHFARRRFLGRKKATDRRVGRRLLSREGRREHHRIGSRLHRLSKQLVETAAQHGAAVALEDLSRTPVPRRRGGARFRRRLSSWPRRALHQQIEYKAAERGVPIYWVNPCRSSITCPRCGAITRPRSRVGPMFTCEACAWTCDRQVNAGVNIGRAVLRETAGLGGLRLALDALPEEAMSPLYPFERSSGHGRSGRGGREGVQGSRRRRGPE
jgi:IS605 OrfB family transposase